MRSLNLPRSLIAALLISAAAGPVRAKPDLKAAKAKIAAGKLVVFVSIDQLRYQDLLLLAPEFGSAGFANLGRPMQLRYDNAITETAADHATLATGGWPSMHGIVANRWLENGKSRQSIDDPACPVWGHPEDGRSAKALRAPTVGDALKIGTVGHARVVSIANKDRVALLLGGTSADLALFWNDREGGFTSTRCYADSAPAWVQALNDASPLASFRDYVWTPSRPAELLARYSDPDAVDVRPARGIGARFPHPIGRGEVSPRLALTLRSTPPATTLAIAAAKAAVTVLSLGDQSQHDLLMLGISTIDGVGHQFGAHAPERIDALLRLHDELGAFVLWLRARFGERVSIVLSADHGLTPIAGQLHKLHLDVPALDRDAIAARLESALTERLGKAADGGYVEFFEPPSMSLRRSVGNAEQRIHLAAEILRADPGFYRVVETQRLLDSELEMQAAPSFVRNSIYPGRSADLIMIPRPLSITKKADDGADHGSPWNDDALVPLMLSAPGWSVRQQFRGGTVLATQVAPTLSALLGVSPPGAALDEPLLLQNETSDR